MSEYVNRCILAINGQNIEDFKTFTENERELARQVKLMNKSGSCGVTQRPGCKVDYVVPMEAPEFDFDSVKDGTLTVEYENGKRKIFTGVRTLKIGEEKIDGDNDVVRAIEFMAEKRRVE
ncbi:MAG: hypothetical protein M0036_04940 [Desulfobacteraceae bacterium]|nr:hypothetical protein [Desulfobacteraceae bacterium]